MRHVEVEGSHAVALFKGKVLVARRFAYYVHRGTFALRYLVYMFDVFFVDEQPHAFLRFVGYYFA